MCHAVAPQGYSIPVRTRPWGTWPKRNSRGVWHWRGHVLSTAEADELIISTCLPSFSPSPLPLSCLHLIVFLKKLFFSELILGGLLKEMLPGNLEGKATEGFQGLALLPLHIQRFVYRPLTGFLFATC